MIRRLRPVIAVVALGVILLVVVRAVVEQRPEEEFLGSGLIEADEYQISPKLAGRVAEVLVEEGQEVAKGQLIALLEHEDIDAEIARAEGAVQSAEAGLRELLRGSREEQVRGARARLAQAQAAREGAQRQLATAEEAFAKVTELRQQHDAAAARMRAAEGNLAAARARVDEARRGPTAEEIETARAALRQAEARVSSAQTALQNAEEIYRSQVALETPAIAAATEREVAGSEARLAEQELARTESLRAEEAASQQALERAQAQEASSRARLTGATRTAADAAVQVELGRAQARQRLDAARDAAQEALRAREVAQSQLDVLLAGTREERVRSAEAAVAVASAEVEAARATLLHATELYQDRLVARSQRDSARAALESAQAVEKGARAELDLLLAGHTAEAIELAQGRLAEARAVLQAAQVRRSYCDLSAPAAGTVTEVAAKAGEMVATGAPVVIVTDLGDLWLRAYVSLASLGQIAQGQVMRVRSEAAPHRVFSGRVVRISDEAEFTPKDVQTPDQRIKQVYWVKVALGEAEGLLKPGMPADLLP